jgi:pilus assembly protein CpaB
MKQMWNKLADKQKPLLLFGLAVVVALVVTVLIHGQLKQMTTTQAQARETQTVVVAAVDLPWGTSITGPMVKTMTYLKESLPGGHFTDPAALVGRTNIYPLKAGEPLFESQLAPTTVSQGGVAALG